MSKISQCRNGQTVQWVSKAYAPLRALEDKMQDMFAFTTIRCTTHILETYRKSSSEIMGSNILTIFCHMVAYTCLPRPKGKYSIVVRKRCATT